MAEITHESIAVSEVETGILEVVHRQVHASGQDMGGSLYMERSAAAWLADQVEGLVNGAAVGRVDATIGPDHFSVYLAGSEMQPFFNVHNRRDTSARRGQNAAIWLSEGAARQLVTQLRAHRS